MKAFRLTELESRRGKTEESPERFAGDLRLHYEHGLLQFDSIFGTWQRGGEFRSFVAQNVNRDAVVWGEAELGLKVYGLDGDRLSNFFEVSTFVQGMAAERMYHQALEFLVGSAQPTELKLLMEKIKSWEAEGFSLRIAGNLPDWRKV